MTTDELVAVHHAMVALEQRADRGGQPAIPVGELMAILLGIEHSDPFDRLLDVEIQRSEALVHDYYAQMSPPDLRIFTSVAFVQGVTFALAAQEVIAQ